MVKVPPVEYSVGNSKVFVGEFSYGYKNLVVRSFNSGASLFIGKFCSIANGRIYLGGNHRVDWATTYPFSKIYCNELVPKNSILGHPSSNGDIFVGNDVWLGDNHTIMSGVQVADGAVVAANSVVTKNVRPYEIVGGNPARHIKFRFDSEIIDKLMLLKWWDLDIVNIRHIAPLLCSPPTDALLIELLLKYRNI